MRHAVETGMEISKTLQACQFVVCLGLSDTLRTCWVLGGKNSSEKYVPFSGRAAILSVILSMAPPLLYYNLVSASGHDPTREPASEEESLEMVASPGQEAVNYTCGVTQRLVVRLECGE